MDDRFLDQIEFRWHPEDDVREIASSCTDPAWLGPWNELLRKYVGHDRTDRRATVAPTSAAYVTTGNGYAALLLRGADTGVMDLYNRTPDTSRNELVGRALIGRQDLLTPEIAMRVAAVPLFDHFPPPPGHVEYKQPLLPLPVQDIGPYLADEAMLDRGVHDVSGAAVLIAAVLRKPDHPVTVLVPDGQGAAGLRDGVALPLIWISQRLLGPLLSAADGWGRSFSTFEAPYRRRDVPPPHIAFRSVALYGTAPSGEPPTQVRLDAPLDTSDHIGKAAEMMVRAYVDHGGARLLREMCDAVADCADSPLETRLDAVLDALQTYLPEPVTTSATGPTVRPPAGQEHGGSAFPENESPARPHGARPPVQDRVAAAVPVLTAEGRAELREAVRAAVQEAVPAAVHAEVRAAVRAALPEAAPAAGGAASGAVAHSQQPSQFYVAVYRRMETAEKPDLRMCRWLAVLAAFGHPMTPGDALTVTGILKRRGFFAEELAAGPDAAERMADLLHPLVITAFAQGKARELVQELFAARPVPPLIAEGLAVVTRRLPRDPASALSDLSLRHLYPEAGQRDGHRAQDAQAAGGAALLRLLKWPTGLPATVAGALIWLAPVLLMAFVLVLV